MVIYPDLALNQPMCLTDFVNEHPVNKHFSKDTDIIKASPVSLPTSIAISFKGDP